MLVAGSSVFKAMLAPNFKEGATLAINSVAMELSLPDDSGCHMAIICRILHLRNNDVPDELQYNDLAAIAALADKYDCAEALRAYAHVWINHRLDLFFKTIANCRELLLAAYHFQHVALFCKIGAELIMTADGPLWPTDSDFEERCPFALSRVFGEGYHCSRKWSFANTSKGF